MKTYNVTILETVGCFGLFKGSSKTVEYKTKVIAPNIEEAQIIAEKEFQAQKK